MGKTVDLQFTERLETVNGIGDVCVACGTVV